MPHDKHCSFPSKEVVFLYVNQIRMPAGYWHALRYYQVRKNCMKLLLSRTIGLSYEQYDTSKTIFGSTVSWLGAITERVAVTAAARETTQIYKEFTMNKRIFVVSALAATLSLSANATFAADQNQKQIYGSQLMTQQEQLEYRDKLRVAKTAEEREQIRAEHHKMMQARAQAQGVTLPDEPPARGQG